MVSCSRSQSSTSRSTLRTGNWLSLSSSFSDLRSTLYHYIPAHRSPTWDLPCRGEARWIQSRQVLAGRQSLDLLLYSPRLSEKEDRSIWRFWVQTLMKRIPFSSHSSSMFSKAFSTLAELMSPFLTVKQLINFNWFDWLWTYKKGPQHLGAPRTWQRCPIGLRQPCRAFAHSPDHHGWWWWRWWSWGGGGSG